MQQRRVGTFTMGIVLIFFGFILLISQLKTQNAAIILIKGWPLILVLLGLEVLWRSYTLKDEQTKIKYDILSIIIIGAICATSLGLYVFTQVGVVSRISDMILNQSYKMDAKVSEFIVDDTVKKLVIDASGLQLNVRTSQNNKVTAQAKACIRVNSKEKAQELLQEQEVVYEKEGNTVHMSFNRPISGNISVNEYDIIVPAKLEVEVYETSAIKFICQQIQSDWYIFDTGNVDITISENTNVKLIALVENQESLMGNVDWDIVDQDPSGNKDLPGNSKSLRYEATFGSGKNNIYILESDDITANKLL